MTASNNLLIAHRFLRFDESSSHIWDGMNRNSCLLGYQSSLNTYVGCEFGCLYCYSMQTVREPGHEWGEFLRIREHLQRKLPGELWKIKGRSILIGTMSDPYQPAEKEYRVTRAALSILQHSEASRVGIFTQSPMVADDIEFIELMPNASVHMTVSPLSDEFRRLFEPNSASVDQRLAAIRKLKDHRIQVHVRIAPVFPFVTDVNQDVGDLYRKLVELNVNSIGVDPYQPFSESNRTIREAAMSDSRISQMLSLISSKPDRTKWWTDLKHEFKDLWKEHSNSGIYSYFADHVSYSTEDLVTGEIKEIPRKAEPFIK